jgi:hypothetical protein
VRCSREVGKDSSLILGIIEALRDIPTGEKRKGREWQD